MLFLSAKLYDTPLFSIRSGGRIGTITEPVINPHNLHIDGFYCDIINQKNVQILLDIHVRDFSGKGIIIDDPEDLSESDELVRLRQIITMHFELLGKTVMVNKKKIGKVSDFAIDSDGLFIQKFYIQPRVWQSFKQENLVFDRTNVIEVTDTYIAFSGPEQTEQVMSAIKRKTASADYSASASVISE